MAAICPTDWQRYGESCYLLITRPMNWQDANDTCRPHGALTVPNSEAEQAFIWDIFTSYFGVEPPLDLWFGCSDIEEEGVWTPCSLREEDHAYNKWKYDQPSNKSEQNCAAMKKGFGGRWADRKCSLELCAMCEVLIKSTTIPVFSLQTGPDGRVESKCLVGHVMKELRADGVVSCGKACRSEPRCRSFNLLMEKGSGKMVCQLNNVTRHEAADGNMKARYKCYFFDL